MHKKTKGYCKLGSLDDMEMFIGLSCVLSLLEEMNSLIKFNQLCDAFMCDSLL
jgi:hypothetical protein